MFRKLAGLTAVAGLFIAGTASAQITNTAHDLRGDITGLTEICVVCHAAHNNQNGANELLWNHDASGVAFTPYTSPTLNGASAGPGPTSLLCMGCHDGVVAIDAYGGSADAGGAITDPALTFSANLQQDHPVGVTYDTAADPELNDPAATQPLFGDGQNRPVTFMLQDGAVECASCHDVHAQLSGGITAGANPNLLNVTPTGSALCLACHIK